MRIVLVLLLSVNVLAAVPKEKIYLTPAKLNDGSCDKETDEVVRCPSYVLDKLKNCETKAQYLDEELTWEFKRSVDYPNCEDIDNNVLLCPSKSE